MTKKPGKTTKTAVKTPKKAVKTLEIGEKKPKIAAKVEEKKPEVAEHPAEPEIQYEHVSILALSRMYNIDRQTVRDRIEKAGIKAVSIKANEKLYALDENLEMIIRQDELAEAKLEKIRLETAKIEHDLAVKRGEYGSWAEHLDVGQKVFGKLIKVLTVQLPNRIDKRLHNANSTAEVNQILKTEIIAVLKEAQKDFESFFKDK